MRAAHRPVFLTPEAFLAEEARSHVRHEYVDGDIRAMTGATVQHARVVRRLLTRLDAKLRRPCEALANDVLVHVSAARAYYYPDLVVSCTETPGDSRVIAAPVLVVEVLSDSTEATDRLEKRHNYRSVPSVQAILIVAQDRRYVELDRREPDGGWTRETLTDEGSLDLPGLDVTLDLDDIYAG